MKEQLPNGALFTDQYPKIGGLVLSAEAQLTPHRPDDSVEGSYTAETMASLLR